jgi:drug/metabolite transporter (DMT)-like permease
VLIWTTGLWVVPIAVVFLGERMTGRRWAGLVTGIGGIVLLFEPWQFTWSDRDILLGHGLLIGAAMINAAVTVHIRGHRWASGPFEVLFWQLLLAAGILAVVAAILEGTPEIHWTLGLWGNLAYQAFLSSAFSVWARQTILQRLEATPVSLMLMAVPVVGLLSSALVLGERIGPAGLAGVVSVIGGVVLTLGSSGSMRTGRTRA